MKKIYVFLFPLLMGILSTFAQAVDDVEGAMLKLNEERAHLQQQLREHPEQAKDILSKFLDLGLWKEAEKEIHEQSKLTSQERILLQVKYLLLNNDFHKAEEWVDRLLEENPGHAEALRYRAVLLIEAWKLKDAELLSKELLTSNPHDQEAASVLGRSLLLQKKYPEALRLAKNLQKNYPQSASGYLLEADVYFWDQHPEKAEAPLVHALSLNPFHADARFSYGYAIWRRVDATQLNDMAAQWELALAINPLHFSTHWHWGNGHTNLTFADYADPNEKEIREQLKAADSLFSRQELGAAIQKIHAVAKQFPQSVLPAMHEASLLYSDFESKNRWEELKQSESLFREVLERKAHYGPAHNGLAAVIKSKRIAYLANFDSLNRVFDRLEINDPVNFSKVFPDMDYYPGNRVKAMVWNQLFTSVVYFPFLSKQENAFVIPPLHIDLALAMNSPFFRTSTTFDNRQWMDIRGVGSGAADIGYTERGAYFERNVVLHEYVHLFHGRVLTDQENRKIRALYYHAMENNLTLDYYSQNNESEYFAQTYPAYFEPVKVHPLDFKSMNTTEDLKQKDPEMYAFLDELVKKERAYLAGDTQSMASNWAQVYVNLSRKVASTDLALAFQYLDTALIHDQAYLPAYLAYAQLQQQQGAFEKAEELLGKAEALDRNYAPTYAAYASLRQQQYLKNKASGNSKQEQIDLLNKAISLEKDYQTAAGLHIQLRKVYEDFDEPQEAIRVAEHYARTGPKVSTYLRDRINEAQFFASAHRAYLGDFSELDILEKLVDLNPQNYSFRGMYSDALYASGAYEKAIENMQVAQRILASSGNARPDFDLRIAESLWELERKQEAQPYLERVEASAKALAPEMGLRLVSLLKKTGKLEKAEEVWQSLPSGGSVAYQRKHKAVKEEIL